MSGFWSNCPVLLIGADAVLGFQREYFNRAHAAAIFAPRRGATSGVVQKFARPTSACQMRRSFVPTARPLARFSISRLRPSASSSPQRLAAANGYPNLSTLWQHVDESRPDYTVTVPDYIIRITPNKTNS